MKGKLMAGALIILMVISIVSCGKDENTDSSGSEKVEEQNVIETSISQLKKEIDGNEARAKSYAGNTYKITGYVINVDGDFVDVFGTTTNENMYTYSYKDEYTVDKEFGIRVYFSEDVLASIDSNSEITFIGTVESVETQEFESGIGIKGQQMFLTMKNAEMAEPTIVKADDYVENTTGEYTVDDLSEASAKEYTGCVVSNYSSLNGADIEWKILYAGSIENDEGTTVVANRIYLIAGDYISKDYAPTEILSSLVSDWEFSVRAIDEYTSSDDLTDEAARGLSSKYLDKLASAPKHTSDKKSIRRALGLMDTTRWSDFKDSNGYAEYAMGGAPVELYIAAYNNYYNTNMNVYVSSTEGYFAESDEFEQDGFFIIATDEKANGMWLASPADSQKNDESVLEVSYFGTMSAGDSNLVCGIRPIVCLDRDVILTKQADGTFIISK
jgi:hypothetical protein